MASDVLNKCNEAHQLIAQDLLVCEIDIFYGKTVLDLALQALAEDFVCLMPVQQLLNDVWYDQLNPHLSNWKVRIIKQTIVNTNKKEAKRFFEFYCISIHINMYFRLRFRMCSFRAYSFQLAFSKATSTSSSISPSSTRTRPRLVLGEQLALVVIRIID